MGLLYSDDTLIQKIEQYKELKKPSEKIKEGKRLSGEIMVNDLLFDELYDLWFDVCIDYVINGSAKEEQKKIRKLFFPDSQETECKNFMSTYCKRMVMPVSNPVCPKIVCNQIQKEVEQHMKGMPEYMKLRVLAVCVLLNNVPERVFTDNWKEIVDSGINEAKYKADYLKIEDGMEFSLNFETHGKLIPKTLRNESDDSCKFKVRFNENIYSIQMPPFGILRGVFADAECKTLVSIKGNISFHDAKSAVIQQGWKEEYVKIYDVQGGIMNIPIKGSFFDISTNGKGGVVFLNAQKLFSTMRLNVTEDLPIRCYGSGKTWAWLYADGKLKSNLEGAEVLEHVTAVVEDGERGLLIYNQEGCWDFRKLPKEKINDSKMAQIMLERFSVGTQDGYCESVSSRRLQLSISKNGRMEAKKLQ